jgi:hypothetical protein
MTTNCRRSRTLDIFTFLIYSLNRWVFEKQSNPPKCRQLQDQETSEEMIFCILKIVQQQSNREEVKDNLRQFFSSNIIWKKACCNHWHYEKSADSFDFMLWTVVWYIQRISSFVRILTVIKIQKKFHCLKREYIAHCWDIKWHRKEFFSSSPFVIDEMKLFSVSLLLVQACRIRMVVVFSASSFNFFNISPLLMPMGDH